MLERARVGQTWRNRWNSFCLVTPNWSVQLPGGAYDGPDPDGFMPHDEIVGYLERYAAESQLPVREGVDVGSLRSLPGGGFLLRTSSGDLCAEVVVLATGAYQRPHRPAAAATLPTGLHQIDVDDYRSEQALPAGRVLVVGSGQSGCQIAEELHEAGRDVVLARGRAPWAPRRFGGRDLLWWGKETGFLDATVESLPASEARLFANHRDRSRRRARPPSAHPPGQGSHPRRTSARRHRRRGSVRRGPRGDRRVGGRAVRPAHEPRASARPGARIGAVCDRGA